MSKKQTEERWPEPVYLTKDHAINMSLRDYFAAKAMVGILTATAKRDDKNYDEDALAFLSYTVADAMLKARGQT